MGYGTKDKDDLTVHHNGISYKLNLTAALRAKVLKPLLVEVDDLKAGDVFIQLRGSTRQLCCPVLAIGNPGVKTKPGAEARRPPNTFRFVDPDGLNAFEDVPDMTYAQAIGWLNARDMVRVGNIAPDVISLVDAIEGNFP